MGALPELDDYFDYPDAMRDETVVDNYHGVLIPDPYRWLEDAHSKQVKHFVSKQAELTESLLQTCETREKLREHISKLSDRQRYSRPFRRGNKYFYFCNTGLQPQSVLYVQDNFTGEPEVLFDPNKLGEDGTIALSNCSVSENGEYVAVGLSSRGSDWVNIKIIHVPDKCMEPDSLLWVKFTSIAWTQDNRGFFYSRFPSPMKGEEVDQGTETNINLNHQVYYHILGTNQSEDILCWKDLKNPKRMFKTAITEDGKYIILYIREGCKPMNMVYYCDITTLSQQLEEVKGNEGMLHFIKLVDNFDAHYHLILNNQTSFTFRTNKNASRYKLACVDIREPESWKDMIEESKIDVLVSAHAINNDKLLICYLRDVKYVLQVRHSETGQLLHNLSIDIGTISGISGRRDDSVAFINFRSFLTPSIIYECNLDSEKPELQVFRESVISHFDRSEFETKQVFVSSKDGTKIPMFIVSKKNFPLNGRHPALLYGYGGFNISVTPSLNIARIVIAKHLGAICAIANVRGGGEYGEEWHKAGSLENKQNCFDDFISCAEFLISEGYTQPKRLCIEGGSNGGLLVASCVNQRPDLFGCALAQAGVMDMLRFHKFTIGHAWTTEYGSSENEEEFHRLIKYSPLHNVKKPWEMTGVKSSQYPAIMLFTADHDDRVVPLHSLKLLATMQYVLCKSVKNSPQTNPIIARLETKSGHGAGSPTFKRIERAADRYSFMAKMVGASWID
ncbi:uncharacterized protein LOC131077977 [Cryptomeria japonica]|uniref:uncharacterized protein LOC131077977 n=1 Tax=Cryptomeria japonica TaxID=3369 RepID=UPI0025AD5417|nr:uncharacterized protein LOC131077977 [Cryptomeria japonica]